MSAPGGAVNPRSESEAVAWGIAQIGGPRIWYGLCDHFVAQCYGWSYSGFGSAKAQWNAEPAKYGDRNPPQGALCFWNTGSPYGHVALSCGDGTVLSTDISVHGGISRVPLSQIAAKWNAKWLGWTPPAFLGKAGGRSPDADTTGISVTIADPLTSQTASGSNTQDAAGMVGGYTQAGLGTVFSNLTNLSLWLRIGLFLIGALLAFIGVGIFTGKSVGQSLSKLPVIPV